MNDQVSPTCRIKIEKRFIANEDIKKVIEDTKQYFITNGFIDFKEDSGTIEFNRGSNSHNLFAFNPLTWKSIITISFVKMDNGTEVMANFDINTHPQTVLENESALWYGLADNYQKRIAEGKSEDIVAIERQVKKDTWKFFGYIILMAVVVGFLGGFIGEFVKQSAGSIADFKPIVLGLFAVLIISMINKRKTDDR